MQLLEMINDVVSCDMQLLRLQTDVCVFDFRTAFDKVGHNQLVEVMVVQH